MTIKKIELSTKVAQELVKNGFTVLSMRIKGRGKPVIYIKNSHLCLKLGGDLIKQTWDKTGEYKIYGVEFTGIQVRWRVG